MLREFFNSNDAFKGTSGAEQVKIEFLDCKLFNRHVTDYPRTLLDDVCERIKTIEKPKFLNELSVMYTKTEFYNKVSEIFFRYTSR